MTPTFPQHGNQQHIAIVRHSVQFCLGLPDAESKKGGAKWSCAICTS